MQIIGPPNSVETVRFEINNHVITRISLSVDPYVMSEEYLVRFGLPVTVSYWNVFFSVKRVLQRENPHLQLVNKNLYPSSRDK